MNAPSPICEPYPGLRSFQRDEAHLFFGRETAVNAMIDRLAQHHFLAVTGTSGSGKSSLVRTGLLDALDRGVMARAGADWLVADFRPGARPLTAMTAALIEATGVSVDRAAYPLIEAKLARGPRALIEWLVEIGLPESTNLVLLVDQFEEIFRFQQRETADDINAFVALLLTSAKQRDQRIYIVITMRSDFLGECAQFSGLAEAINDGQFLTPRLTREQCQQAIEGPAAVCGGRVEPALVTRLLNDMGGNPDQLPLMQHVLMRLWRMAPRQSGTASPVLSLADYESLGGIGGGGQPGALSKHADEILRELNEAQRRLTETLFRALTESEGAAGRDVRRPAALGEIAAIATVTVDELIPVVEAFRRPGRNLLMAPINVPLQPDDVVDISHESLIRQWAQLREWVREEFVAAENYRHVEATAKRWAQGDAALWTMPDLGVALAWRTRQNPNLAWAERYGDAFPLAMKFLDKSEAEELARADEAEKRRVEAEEAERLREREAATRRLERRTRFAAIALGALFIVAVAAGLLAYRAGLQASKNYLAATNVVRDFTGKVLSSLRNAPGIRVDTVDKVLVIAQKMILSLPNQGGSAPRDEIYARTLYEFAKTYQFANTFDKALSAADESLVLRNRLVALDPSRADWKLQQAESLDQVGDLERSQGLTIQARENYEAGLTIRRSLIGRQGARERSEAEMTIQLSQSLVRLGDLDMPSARPRYEEAFELIRKALAQDPDNRDLQRELSWDFNKIGDFLLATNEYSAAQAYYDRALCVRRHLASRDPGDTQGQSDVSWSLDKIGLALLKQNEIDAARPVFAEELGIRRLLSDADSSNFRFRADLAVSRQRMSELALQTNDNTGALAFAEGAKEIREEIVRLSPQDQAARRQLASSVKLIGGACQKLSNAEQCTSDWQPIVDREEKEAVSLPQKAQENAHSCWAQLVASLAESAEELR